MPAPVREVDELGTLIREARRKLGMTQASLAKEIGFSQNYTSQVETGYTADVGSLLVGRLADVLKIPIAELSRAASLRAERARSHGGSLPVEGNDITDTDIAPEDAPSFESQASQWGEP